MGIQTHVIPSYPPLAIFSHGWVAIYDFLFTNSVEFGSWYRVVSIVVARSSVQLVDFP